MTAASRISLSRRACVGLAALLASHPLLARAQAAGSLKSPTAAKALKAMSNETAKVGEAEMAAARNLTTKVLAIGSWTAKAPPEARPAVMPHEARDTLRLQLAGKIDQWFAKTDGSGAVFLMNVTDPAEAHRLLEALPLGRAGMMVFDLIPIGPLWPLGLLLQEPAK
jgi:hypothetical protein